MRELLFGHSYVNHLRQLGGWNREITLQNNSRVNVEFLFKSYPGKDFRYFLDNIDTSWIMVRPLMLFGLNNLMQVARIQLDITTYA